MNAIQQIRDALVPVLSDGRWADIEESFARVRLKWRPDLNPGSGKPAYVKRVLAPLSDQEVIELATQCLEAFSDRTVALQNALWHHDAGGRTQVSGITRRAIADWFDDRCLHHQLPPTEFLARFATPAAGPASTPSIAYDTTGRLIRSGPFTAEFYDQFGEPDEPGQSVGHHVLLESYAFSSWPDKRVFSMLEALVEPTLRRGTEQQSWVAGINEILMVDGFELRESARISGHPVYRVERRNVDRHRRPRNLIFASIGPKPELGFTSALDNDIVVLRNSEHCLFYDEPVGDEGLTWSALATWWTRLNGGSDRRALGERLMASLASPPELELFKGYFRQYATVLDTRLPALLPQVYLHYDPATRQQLRRHGLEPRFLVQRMDFLMLFRDGVRVVLEVDGQQHYATGMDRDARPSPAIYAATASSDRDLRLAGYEVYRFGGAELGRESAASTIATFFDRLFQRHGVT